MSSNTKLIVLKSKELIYTGIFIIIGILLICLLVYMFSPKNNKAPSTKNKASEASTTEQITTETMAATNNIYTPGVYTSIMTLGGNTLSVNVTVDYDRISHVEIANLDESITAMYPLLTPSLDSINSQLSSINSLDDLTYDANQEYTTILICDAIKRALEQ